ncbi:gamma-glutamylcyclotransferase isoform X1 [Egretta garzetta]|uniref:gamma-glutamylcyclotransferase isoform X1 n=1 Tax=Egretta garzetta TaxID=188379 RepID=UPI00163BA9B3|nr:gamma-glutamylcyclotransferase isoform X1 [Egretta garzetta]
MVHLSQGLFRLSNWKHISNPVTANLGKSQADISSALLRLLQNGDFKLEFGHHQGRTSSVWHGGTATIVQSPGDEVWGIVWKMNASNLSSLDKQEGVEDGIYVPIEVNVHTEAGKVLTCRSYQMKDYVCGPPSPQYKKVICMGAKQNGLPTDYQKKLEAIETNNYTGTLPIMEEIEAAIKAKKINSA